jgi:hypothetical protein
LGRNRPHTSRRLIAAHHHQDGHLHRKGCFTEQKLSHVLRELAQLPLRNRGAPCVNRTPPNYAQREVREFIGVDVEVPGVMPRRCWVIVAGPCATRMRSANGDVFRGDMLQE